MQLDIVGLEELEREYQFLRVDEVLDSCDHASDESPHSGFIDSDFTQAAESKRIKYENCSNRPKHH